MNIWALNKISNQEKSDILSQHRHLYNGYTTINPEVPNKQPLYVQDFAKDKDGIVINNMGNTKKYTNFGINESKSDEICEECGPDMYEGECMECGEEKTEGIYDVNDIKKSNKFDYVENDIDEEDNGFEHMESAFKDEYTEDELDEWAAPLLRAAATGAGAELAGGAANYVSGKFESKDLEGEVDEDLEGEVDEDLEEEVDDDLRENFKSEKMRIMEMMNRMNVIK